MKEILKKDWFKIIVAILAASLVGLTFWKVINADFNFKFNFNDFLSLILALFSIWLSVAFYFKATDQSDQFYQNSLTLTKDLSVILGKIESRFGENLRHLEEGNLRLQDKLDSIGEKQIRLKENEDVVNEYVEIKKYLEDLLNVTGNENSLNDKDKEKVKELEKILKDLETEITAKESTIYGLKDEIEKQKKNEVQITQQLSRSSRGRGPEILVLKKDRKGQSYVNFSCTNCVTTYYIEEEYLLKNKTSNLSKDDGYMTKITCPNCDSLHDRIVLY